MTESASVSSLSSFRSCPTFREFTKHYPVKAATQSAVQQRERVLPIQYEALRHDVLHKLHLFLEASLGHGLVQCIKNFLPCSDSFSDFFDPFNDAVFLPLDNAAIIGESPDAISSVFAPSTLKEQVLLWANQVYES